MLDRVGGRFVDRDDHLIGFTPVRANVRQPITQILTQRRQRFRCRVEREREARRWDHPLDREQRDVVGRSRVGQHELQQRVEQDVGVAGLRGRRGTEPFQPHVEGFAAALDEPVRVQDQEVPITQVRVDLAVADRIDGSDRDSRRELDDLHLAAGTHDDRRGVAGVGEHEPAG